MSKEELYKTKRMIYIYDSKDQAITVGQKYPVYMNDASTLGIIDDKEAFIPLAFLICWGVDWTYDGKDGREWN
jgi:hypothetical protein